MTSSVAAGLVAGSGLTSAEPEKDGDGGRPGHAQGPPDHAGPPEWVSVQSSRIRFHDSESEWSRRPDSKATKNVDADDRAAGKGGPVSYGTVQTAVNSFNSAIEQGFLQIKERDGERIITVVDGAEPFEGDD